MVSGLTMRTVSINLERRPLFLDRGVEEENMAGLLADFIFMGWRRVGVWWSCVPASTLANRLTDEGAGTEELVVVEEKWGAACLIGAKKAPPLFRI